ncbi:bola-like protein [Sistotremastrum niveocremeum HHB9708]|uniref:Bola-like protein n=1 Tax=Sistotremastrum niveocremeum HHB9708 TaxID=1314777 RepID=A0A164WHA3_9AGAM|nr:bola-like protein [Sistotremastrum niveocremeum HHB9708]
MPVSVEDLEKTLRSAIKVEYLEIVDESSGCGESYRILVVSDAFEGKGTLARHRFVNEILKDYISQMHAFSQKSLTVKQYQATLN